jgi:hypothetical protein
LAGLLVNLNASGFVTKRSAFELATEKRGVEFWFHPALLLS